MTDPSPQPEGSALLRALRPTWAWALACATALAFRFSAWGLRLAFERADVRPVHVALGVAYDVLLVTALLWATRGAATLLPVRRTPALSWAVAGVASVALAVRTLDLGHCYLVQCHWAPEAFLYLEPSYLRALARPTYIAALAGALVPLLALPALIRWDLRVSLAASQRPRDPAGTPGAPVVPAAPRATLGVALLLAASAAAALPAFDAFNAPEDVFNPRLVPELNFVVQWRAWRHSDDAKATVTPLPPETRTRLAQAGVIPAGDPVLPGYPLVQRGLGEPPVPHPLRPGTAQQRPNVVLAVVESLDSLFVHGLSGRYRGVMPELSKLAAAHTRVDAFYNTATPTISALTALLCSVNPPTHPRDMAEGKRGEVLTAHTCLSDLLHHAGYRTVFVMGSPSSMTRTGDFLKHHGFDEVHDRADFEARYPGRALGHWGAYDDAMVDYVQEQIVRLEALKTRDGRPYLLLFMTIDTHEPGMAKDSCALPHDAQGRPTVDDVPDDAAAERLLAAYHCTDRELGRLFRFLGEPTRAADTLWLLTGDHVAFRTATSRPLLAGRREGWSFARMPLLLHDPRRALPKRVPVLGGTLDIAPTVLHLLGTRVGLHSLTGRSLFGRRKDHPFVLGRLGGRLAFARNGASGHEASRSTLETICEGRTLLLPKGPNPLTACDVLTWMAWQDQLWDARRLFPRTVYWGESR